MIELSKHTELHVNDHSIQVSWRLNFFHRVLKVSYTRPLKPREVRGLR